MFMKKKKSVAKKKSFFLAQANKSVASQLSDPGCDGPFAIWNVAVVLAGAGNLMNSPLALKTSARRDTSDFLHSPHWPYLIAREVQDREVQPCHTSRRKGTLVTCTVFYLFKTWGQVLLLLLLYK